ncbi:hypothetical protein ED146_20615 [Escherichia coli]|nr:hypothetical protein [Escherichia coli]EAM3031525.1 hypothetical protein [Salmonella enterica]EBF6821851.1 hypothetical protein [Salmonella enterica subsp. enterica serovar Mbandaka]EBY1879875.1 hypothetical protein [Salmonella enterica subsp. enterica serovar Senftenberg]ECI3638193.1 hypothetical protein [Salmonella enterica subsp. enterica]EEZ5668544.1 hypothetical protein [Escherichia coli O2]EEZ5784002.1 hypothetical protein [Escherichia coli O107]EGC9297116.1 hypothetical protein [Sa
MLTIEHFIISLKLRFVLTLNDTPLCGETVIQKHTNAGINFG